MEKTIKTFKRLKIFLRLHPAFSQYLFRKSFIYLYIVKSKFPYSVLKVCVLILNFQLPFKS